MEHDGATWRDDLINIRERWRFHAGGAAGVVGMTIALEQ
jgi:hypothetical protein